MAAGQHVGQLTLSSEARTFRPLRVMIVDDNHINLAMLSRLLTRKFPHVLEDTPVTVDSALKAIQLLQQRVFDVILMDIQMPFLNGLEATMRIRNAEDGVLHANRTAHIVAVTTAVGDEPEAAYRRGGMDGMIGKPVRAQDIELYLNTLSQQADRARPHTSPITVNDVEVLPPLPPVAALYERAFYLPTDATIRSPVDDICADSGFERALHAQTLSSLQSCGLKAIAHAQTSCDDESAAKAEGLTDDIHVESGASTPALKAEPTDSSSSRCSKQTSPTRPRHIRGATLSNELFSQQIAREIANSETVDDAKHVRRASRLHSYPLTASLSQESSQSDSVHPTPEESLAGSPVSPDQSSAPSLRRSPLMAPRRDSEMSNSDSVASDTSTDITTPSSESEFDFDNVSASQDAAAAVAGSAPWVATGKSHLRSDSCSTLDTLGDSTDGLSIRSSATDDTFAGLSQSLAYFKKTSDHDQMVTNLGRLAL